MKLSEALAFNMDAIFEKDAVNRHLDVEIVKEFSMKDGAPWFSWQQFGTHKNVRYWYLLENGYAVGFNENASIGISFPVKKLSPEMVEKAKKHMLTYSQYHDIQ